MSFKQAKSKHLSILKFKTFWACLVWNHFQQLKWKKCSHGSYLVGSLQRLMNFQKTNQEATDYIISLTLSKKQTHSLSLKHITKQDRKSKPKTIISPPHPATNLKWTLKVSSSLPQTPPNVNLLRFRSSDGHPNHHTLPLIVRLSHDLSQTWTSSQSTHPILRAHPRPAPLRSRMGMATVLSRPPDRLPHHRRLARLVGLEAWPTHQGVIESLGPSVGFRIRGSFDRGQRLRAGWREGAGLTQAQVRAMGEGELGERDGVRLARALLVGWGLDLRRGGKDEKVGWGRRRPEPGADRHAREAIGVGKEQGGRGGGVGQAGQLGRQENTTRAWRRPVELSKVSVEGGKDLIDRDGIHLKLQPGKLTLFPHPSGRMKPFAMRGDCTTVGHRSRSASKKVLIHISSRGILFLGQTTTLNVRDESRARSGGGTKAITGLEFIHRKSGSWCQSNDRVITRTSSTGSIPNLNLSRHQSFTHPVITITNTHTHTDKKRDELSLLIEMKYKIIDQKLQRAGTDPIIQSWLKLTCHQRLRVSQTTHDLSRRAGGWAAKGVTEG